jgi:hypothetical protein
MKWTGIGKMEAPKTLGIRKRNVKTLAEANQYIDELIEKIEFLYKYLRPDIEKIEKRLTDGGL